MRRASVVVRPVELRDVQHLRDHCFSVNTTDDVRARVEGAVHRHETGQGIQLVAEVDGRVVGTLGLIRKNHPLFAHRAEVVDVVVHGDYQQQVNAMQALADLAERDEDHRRRVVAAIRSRVTTGSAAVRSRGLKLLERLTSGG